MLSELTFLRPDVVSRPVFHPEDAKVLNTLLNKHQGEYREGLPLALFLPELKSLLQDIWYTKLAPDIHGLFMSAGDSLEWAKEFRSPRVCYYSPDQKLEARSGPEQEILIYVPLGEGEGGDLFLPRLRYSTKSLATGEGIIFPAEESHGVSKVKSGDHKGLFWLVPLFKGLFR